LSPLRASNLRKRFRDTIAVDGISFEVGTGEIFGLLGPNGAGKTTTIKMLSGLLTPCEGSVVIGGVALTRSSTLLRRKIGYVPQELALYEDLSARENLRFFASPFGLRGKLRDERIEWALDVAGLRDRSRAPVKRFSGGMKRRLNLVVALLHKPSLLILDEPTVGVDPQSRSFLFDAIHRLRSEQSMTVVYTSHYLDEVQALCDRVAIVDHGKLVALDRVDNLLRNERPRVHIDVDADSPRIRKILGPEIATQVADGRACVRLQDCAAALQKLQDAAVSIRGLKSDEATLESVFLKLTGRALRDGAP
jgi:ABC-2 type transport system ATP-binding protein